MGKMRPNSSDGFGICFAVKGLDTAAKFMQRELLRLALHWRCALLAFVGHAVETGLHTTSTNREIH